MVGSVTGVDVFEQAIGTFDGIRAWLESTEALGLQHFELESRLRSRGHELLRQLLQAHLDVRTQREPRLGSVVGSDGRPRRSAEASGRGLMSVFGPVRAGRLAYGSRGAPDLHPADATLNLPAGRASHGLRKLVAEEASKVSFDDVVKSVDTHTGGHVGKRQAEELTQQVSQDFDEFYRSCEAMPCARSAKDLLVLSSDGKGIVMIHRDLRGGTRKAARAAAHKLDGRLSPGEKHNRKRMATVAAVYDVPPFVRQPADVLADLRRVRSTGKPRPKARNKRVWASVEKEPQDVAADMFDEAQRRDPKLRRQWVVLVDGDPRQIERIEAEAERRAVEVVIVLDLIHVLEYLWKAAWCFFEKGEKGAQVWVAERATAVLEGKSSNVAAGIRRSATLNGLSKTQRAAVDKCCDYLIAKRPYLQYDEYLAAGYPISTGVIEGACRHLICDRLDITGARWSLHTAEAVLRIRSLRSSSDFETYWGFHMAKEHKRNHANRYADGGIPTRKAA